MLICKVGEWRVESDGLVSSQSFSALRTLGELEQLREEQAARAASVAAKRVRDSNHRSEQSNERSRRADCRKSA